MATDMVIGNIYILESDATDNIDWVPNVDNIILGALYTEGTEYIKLEIPQKYKIQFRTGITVTDSGAGTSFDRRAARRAYLMLANGIETSRDNAALVRNFFMLDRHTSGTASVFKRYYLVIKWGATDYEPFIDASSTSRDYCKGVVINGDTEWDEDTSLVAIVRLNWRSVW
jgi:hypothetical protein